LKSSENLWLEPEDEGKTSKEILKETATFMWRLQKGFHFSANVFCPTFLRKKLE
jgi:hypothetical protein